jgi:DNA repair photolyase
MGDGEGTSVLEPLVNVRRRSREEDIAISVGDEEAKVPTVRERLASLDVFRGITIAVYLNFSPLIHTLLDATNKLKDTGFRTSVGI